jgi:predicted nucleic acid binding AN1-type Zn finger protein
MSLESSNWVKKYEPKNSNEFITIIPDDKMDDLHYVQTKIDQNRTKSLLIRDKINNCMNHLN